MFQGYIRNREGGLLAEPPLLSVCGPPACAEPQLKQGHRFEQALVRRRRRRECPHATTLSQAASGELQAVRTAVFVDCTWWHAGTTCEHVASFGQEEGVLPRELKTLRYYYSTMVLGTAVLALN